MTRIAIGESPPARSKSERVTGAITDMMRSGELKPGARLLSERDLALRLGVSRPSIRQAIAALTQRGLLETRQGAGTVVAAVRENVFKSPFETLLMFDQPSLQELYEVRELVEVHLAGRAAEHRTDDDLAAIESALDAMRGTVDAPEEQINPNVAFHQAIARAGHLPLLEHFVISLHDAMRAAIAATHPGVRDRLDSYEIHARIFDAIRRRSVTDARRAMIVHMAMAVDELTRAAQNTLKEDTKL